MNPSNKPSGDPPRRRGESARRRSREPISGNKADRSKRGANPAMAVVKKICRVLAAIAMLGIIAGCVVGCWLTVYVFDILNDDTKMFDLDAFKLSYTTILYANDSETGAPVEIQRLSSQDGSRIWVDFADIPDVVKNAAIAVEDKRFMTHTGVDFQRTFLSFVNLIGQQVGISIYDGTPGGSTITQQVIRNLSNDRDVSIARKIREIFRALNLEKHYSKDQILESYLNVIPFGNNTNGIQAAANLYFNKDVSQLTAAEAASIIGITNSPTTYNPYTNYDNNQERKEDILYLMHEQGYLTDAEYEAALAEEIVFDEGTAEKRFTYDQSYFVDYVIEDVIDDLVEKLGYTKAEATAALYGGGYRIYTTVDTVVQERLEEIYENPEEYFPAVSNKDEYPQSAFVILDLQGAIKGLVGGTGEKEGARVWNRATDTRRQPGSTIKPISSYALAFENDLVNWSTLIEDGPFTISPGPGQPEWSPRNYYTGFYGYMILEEALQRSTNMIPVRLCDMLTPKYLWSFMHDSLHIGLVESDIGYSPMALGSLTYGVTPMEMAGAYQIFGNGGTYTEPYSYTQVLDANGEVVLEKNTTPTRVLSYETATVMNKLLQRVTTGPYGTGTRAKFRSDIPVAGKTGTTDDDVDQWFIGVTPYYVGVCWMGFDDQIVMEEDENGEKVPVRDAYGNTIPHSIQYYNLPYPPPLLWNTVMSSVHQDLPGKDFEGSASVVSQAYCLDTGYAATADCPRTATGWYKPMNIPTPCPYHGFSIDDNYHLAGDKPWLNEEVPREDQEDDDDEDSRKNSSGAWYNND